MAFESAVDRGPAYRFGSAALFISAASILTALGFQYIGGYQPCMLCLLERYAYYAAIPVLFIAIALASGGSKGWASALAKYSFLNGDRACALGASYGGYMAYWIAGNWSQPWKCIVAHDGVFDSRMMGYSTEELWFDEWENKGTAYDNPEAYERFNPIDHVKDWTVPMLVVHSQLDYRIPIEQGIAAFTALQRKGIASEFLTFPDENHWVLKPQNSVLWHDTVNAWIKRWTAKK